MKLDRTLVLPENRAAWLKLRTQDVTSTETPALFGLSPYCTAFELWHQKNMATVVEVPESPRMVWGSRLQDTIAEGIAEDEGFKIRKMNRYGRVMPVRLGASFDYEIVSHVDGPGVLEVKKVDELVYRDKWVDDEAPEHIEIQLQTQLEVLDRGWGVIGVLIGGNRTKLLHRVRDREVGDAIRNKTSAFWESIVNGIAPPPNFDADAAFINKLYGYAQEGLVMDARDNAHIQELFGRYHAASGMEKDFKGEKDRAKAELLTIIGNHERVLANGWSLSAGMVKGTEPTLITADMVGQSYGGREGYRGWRLTKKEAK